MRNNFGVHSKPKKRDDKKQKQEKTEELDYLGYFQESQCNYKHVT